MEIIKIIISEHLESLIVRSYGADGPCMQADLRTINGGKHWRLLLEGKPLCRKPQIGTTPTPHHPPA